MFCVDYLCHVLFMLSICVMFSVEYVMFCLC